MVGDDDHVPQAKKLGNVSVADISDEQLEILTPLIGALVRLAIRRGLPSATGVERDQQPS